VRGAFSYEVHTSLDPVTASSWAFKDDGGLFIEIAARPKFLTEGNKGNEEEEIFDR
jgi:hypothetical protein